MNKLLKTGFAAVVLSLQLAACSSPDKVPSEGDSGDSATLGAGPDTTGTTVDTGSTVTDSVY